MPVFRRLLDEFSKRSGSAENAEHKHRGEPRSRTMIDAPSLMQIKNLELRAKVVMKGFMAGIHRSPYHGFSVEFTDYRQYSPGDDVRYLDWKLLARQDRLYIKRFEDETNLRCYLLADLSRSMEFGTVGYHKADYARTCLATLAYFLSMQRDAVGLLTFDQQVDQYIPPRFRPGHLRRLILGLERAVSGKRTDIVIPLEQIARTASRRGLIVLASDLLVPIDDLHQNLGFLRAQGHDVMVLRILDPSELAFEFTDPKIFEDLETGRDLFVDPETIRGAYLKRFGEHASQLRQICDEQGVDLVTMTTDRPLQDALFEFVTVRSRFGKRINRNHRVGIKVAKRGGP